MYIIDGSKMTSRKEAYEEIKRAIEAPAYMGSNLDALHEVLTETVGEVRLTHACKMLMNLHQYGCRMLSVFFDAAEENKHLIFTVGGHE